MSPYDTLYQIIVGKLICICSPLAGLNKHYFGCNVMLAAKLKKLEKKEKVNVCLCVLTISWLQQLNTSEAINPASFLKVKDLTVLFSTANSTR